MAPDYPALPKIGLDGTKEQIDQTEDRLDMTDAQTIVTNALKRLADPSFPESNKWAHLCHVPEVADDPVAAKALVRFGLFMKDPFTKEIAQKLLDRFCS